MCKPEHRLTAREKEAIYVALQQWFEEFASDADDREAVESGWAKLNQQEEA